MSVTAAVAGAAPGPSYAGLQAVDETTGRGVPLVEFETVDHVRFVTDTAGWVAFGEPGLLGQTVWFNVRSHGYEVAADGFGFRGVRADVQPGSRTVVRLRRLNIAERLCRLTGAGIYRDSVLLGEPVPSGVPLLNAHVVGQDSTQAAVYRGRVHWFWGDTSRLQYPLGNFRTTGATSELPAPGGFDPSRGIPFRYLTNVDGFVRAMCPFEPRDGLVWIDGLTTVADGPGRERLVARFARLKSLGEMLEHGLVVFDDARQEFDREAAFPLTNLSFCLQGQALRHRDGETDWIHSCLPFPAVRVRAELASVRDPSRYEAWTCLADGSPADPATARVQRDAAGRAQYRWTAHAPPLNPKQQLALIAAGQLKPEEAWCVPVDVESGKPVLLHSGSVRWNPWRQRWILVAVQQEGGPSFLGEVWYAESRTLEGPWRKTRRIVTHDRYTFYNPVQHAFLDQDGGRRICFEGTYANTFSGNPDATPRYDYNQVMYRLDLEDPRLRDAFDE